MFSGIQFKPHNSAVQLNWLLNVRAI
jgi:hypothetical protein